jgi:hypothetical protein
MGFRDTVNSSQSVEERITRVERKVTGSLPAGFSWVITLNNLGEETLSIIHDSSGRIVLQGF